MRNMRSTTELSTRTNPSQSESIVSFYYSPPPRPTNHNSHKTSAPRARCVTHHYDYHSPAGQATAVPQQNIIYTYANPWRLAAVSQRGFHGNGPLWGQSGRCVSQVSARAGSKLRSKTKEVVENCGTPAGRSALSGIERHPLDARARLCRQVANSVGQQGQRQVTTGNMWRQWSAFGEVVTSREGCRHVVTKRCQRPLGTRAPRPTCRACGCATRSRFRPVPRYAPGSLPREDHRVFKNVSARFLLAPT